MSSAIEATETGQIETHLDWLSGMHRIRMFEEEVQALFTKGVVRGSTHLCQGQEAVSVGACAALEEGDTMACTYRGHGAVLAKGAPLDRCFGEIMGKAGGLCAGKGGSMHLTHMESGALGSFAIIGAHLPIVCGAALAAQYRGSDRVSLCFFGDGSTNIGAFHEALNLASIWKLPVIFVCENNLYGEYSPVASTTPIERLSDRADSYAMAKDSIDGQNVLTVHAAVTDAVERARRGEGPTLLEARTYRYRGHSRSDPAKYRPEGELEAWLKRDPILRSEEILRAAGVAEERLDQARAEAEKAVVDALERATGWSDPELTDRWEHVWA
jgi:acetoin:2,6-dichlorophenolindophenol oxidoreductase subunit alpha